VNTVLFVERMAELKFRPTYLAELKFRPTYLELKFRPTFVLAGMLALVGPHFSSAAYAQQPAAPPPTTAVAPPAVPSGVELPPGYVIGAEDVLTVIFWRDKEMSTEVAVRPDGKVTLPLVNDVDAAGKTPEQLRVAITEAASRFVEEPTVSVVVKAINSRKVYITGMVAKSGAFPLSGSTTVLQLISMAGGLHEFADSKNIIINRVENGKQVALKFNYNDVRKGKKLQQNIELRPGDTVVVP
jgi:polysaccharide export outer membrane protein